MTLRYPRLRPVALAVVAALTASVLFGALPGGAAPASAATTCTPVQIVAFRGSGEAVAARSYTGTTVKTNGWEGSTLSRTIQAYLTQSRGKTAPNPRVDEVPITAVGPNQWGTATGYPAVAVPRTADVSVVKQALGASARAGATSTAAFIDRTVGSQTAAGCPSPKFVVLGYSQGAVAARWLTQLRPKHIAMSQLFGDPLQFAGQLGNHGNGAGGNGFLRYVSTDTEKRTDNGYYSVTGPAKAAVCHTGDPICDYNWLLVGVLAILLHQMDEHYSYVTQAAETAQEGQLISRKVAELLTAAGSSGRSAQTLAPGRNYVDDIDVESLMTGETTVVDADSAEAYLAPLAVESPSPAPGEASTRQRSGATTTLTIRSGDTLQLSAGDVPAGEQYGFRITAETAEGSWRLPALLTSGVQTSTGGPQTVPLTVRDLPPGTYSGGILTETFTHTPDVTIVVLP